MTNSEAKQQYEGAILQQLVKNAEKLAVIEFDFNQFKPKINKIDGIETEIAEIKNRLLTIESKITTIESKITTIESKITTIESTITDIQSTNKKIESILKILNWIGGGIIAIILSIAANFLYSFLG